MSTSDQLAIQSFSRVLELPMVMSAWQVAVQRYDQLKHYSPLVESSLNKAEQTVQLAAEVTKPIVRKLEKPITFADSLVCQGLDKFEQLVPAIKKSPTEIKKAGWQKYEEVRGFGNQKVDSIKAFGYDQVNQALASAYAIAVMKYVDAAIDVTDQIVDRYLPPAKEEEEKLSENADVVRRLSFVTDKMRHRMYGQAINAAQAAISRLQETTGQVLTTNSHHNASNNQDHNQQENAS